MSSITVDNDHCKTCGLCCIYYPTTNEKDHWAWIDEWELNKYNVPKKLYQIEKNPDPEYFGEVDNIAFIQGKKDALWGDDTCDYYDRSLPFRRCVALEGEQYKDAKCGVYENRPATCRDFVVGSKKCNEIRDWGGLEPIVDVLIGLDVDGVCLDFDKAFIKECAKQDIHLEVEDVWNFFEQDERSYEVFKNLSDEFWMTLERTQESKDLNIQPAAYISHRSCNPEITRECLEKLGFPYAQVIHVENTQDKVKVARREGIDLFVDDRASTVVFFIEDGLDAVLFDKSYNKRFTGMDRIKTLGELNKYVKKIKKDKTKAMSGGN